MTTAIRQCGRCGIMKRGHGCPVCYPAPITRERWIENLAEYLRLGIDPADWPAPAARAEVRGGKLVFWSRPVGGMDWDAHRYLMRYDLTAWEGHQCTRDEFMTAYTGPFGENL